ncbi:MAG TPA: alpha-1,4-glucan--maltose-1-phosphate maltosyltransferase [Woeseiaceae bacterium]|nr:alpha-1,4-glucan--maltose-1-phosphate maltosyltransferase [Woeseiaceae bacterium]
MAADARTEGLRRAVIESVCPHVDCGRFPIKRAVGERVVVEADAFTDGHDRLVCMLRFRKKGARDWRETEMAPLGNDRWRGEFRVEETGRYQYGVAAWVDRFLSWTYKFERREDDADIASALKAAVELIQSAAKRARGPDRKRLQELCDALGSAADPLRTRREIALGTELATLMRDHADRSRQTVHDRELEVVVDPPRARFSSWYELFPRSTANGAPGHATLKDCIERLPYIAGMGFDVLYLPPVHPIGRTNRKGPDNVLHAGPDDPGSPWAIGAKEGGHKSVHPELGSLEDFRKLCAAAAERGIEVALDIAFQCSPDHPYVREHPEWFRHRPDGTIQYAENPPKKYQDIYPFDFESDDWEGLWEELASVFEFWIEQGVTIFRVDNPHTKAFAFWEWVIDRIKSVHPDVIFLSEAFTRPRVMHRLAKLGFTQSYTYFTWRNTKHEIIEYLTELSRHRSREYFRPNLWPNTPDILHEYLQAGGRPAFVTRLTLAATLAASYGVYGPAYELIEHEPRERGSEEYKASEKYQLRQWNLDRPESLCHFIARLNRIRRENPALQSDWTLRFHEVDNEQLVCYSKSTEDLKNLIVVVANLDPYYRQSGFVVLPLDEWQMDPDQPYQLHDLLSDSRYLWQGPRNYVELDPQGSQAHVFRIRRRVLTEQDFDYYF